MKLLPLPYVKNVEALEKTWKIRQNTNIIKVKGKNLRKVLFLLLWLTQSIPLTVVEILKNKIKIDYSN